MKYLLPVLFLASCASNSVNQKNEIEKRIDSLNVVQELNFKESAKLVEEILEHKKEVDHLRQEVNEHKESLANLKLSDCLLYTSPSPRDRQKSRMPSSA